ncbi:alpha/beta hydrolase family protein [Nonomuraea sp. NPDC050556]|uniref:alpha/beta hydrolase family protein n=1 Tax=Nonomuraea sp. NPDC050556 TaxID=3364369 RepID=UPI0037A95E84
MDARLTTAIATWGPRFTANGVSLADFQRITNGLQHWGQWCAAWSEVAAEHSGLGHDALAARRHVSAGEHLARAALYYHYAKFVFVEDRAQMRRAHDSAVRCLNAALPYLRPRGRRVEMPFGRGTLVGVLRLPERGQAPFPVVVLVAGLDSAKEEMRAHEAPFLARGVATFSVDGPGQGEAEYDLPIRGDWSGPGLAIVDALSALPEIDARRIAVWGVSLGGYYACRIAAALGHRVRACVTLGGPYDYGDCWPGLPDLTRQAFTVRSGARSQDEAAGIAGTLSLAGVAGEIRAPLLIVFGRQDRLFPWKQAERLAATAGGEVELLMLEGGNHGCANLVPWHQPYTADWVAHHLTRQGAFT